MPAKRDTKAKFIEKYETIAYYKILGKETCLRVFRSSLDECHQWLGENKTTEVSVTDGIFRTAKMTRYMITKVVTMRNVVERMPDDGEQDNFSSLPYFK